MVYYHDRQLTASNGHEPIRLGRVAFLLTSIAYYTICHFVAEGAMDAQFIETCLPNLTHYTGIENRKEVLEICKATIEGCRDQNIQVYVLKICSQT